jgi:Cu/Ag efflux protein CusF
VITEIRGDVVQIDHETIPGFMVAVTMDFPVEDPAVLRGLVPGDRVSFSLLRPNDQSYRILGIERLVDPPE